MTHEGYLERIGKKHVQQVERLSGGDAPPVVVNAYACCACGGQTSARFWICSDCSREFGKFKNWPDWLKFLKNDEQNRRRLSDREDEEGVVSECDLPEGVGEDADEDVELGDFPLYVPQGAFVR